MRVTDKEGKSIEAISDIVRVGRLTTAKVEDVLEGETYITGEGKLEIGEMTNNEAQNIELEPGKEYIIPQGYHSGLGKVVAKSIAAQTGGTAEAGDILSGKTAYVKGVEIPGSMPDNGATTIELEPGETKTIPQGYHNGSGTVTSKKVTEFPDLVAVEDNITIPKGVTKAYMLFGNLDNGTAQGYKISGESFISNKRVVEITVRNSPNPWNGVSCFDVLYLTGEGGTITVSYLAAPGENYSYHRLLIPSEY